MSQNKRNATQKETPGKKKKQKTNDFTGYLFQCLNESGLILKPPPEKSIINNETVNVIRNIKKTLEKHFDYPRNISELMKNLEKQFTDLLVFKHFLYPNVVKIEEEGASEHSVNDSVVKILLSIPVLQNKMIDYIFERASDLAVESACGPWIQMILRCFTTLHTIVSTDKIAVHLINLLDVTSEKTVKLEIISAIPDIIGDQEHENIASEMSRFLSEDYELIPAVLDCLSYLCLSDQQCQELQKKTLTILRTSAHFQYFPNFVEFLLMSGRMDETGCIEIVQGLKTALGWNTPGAKTEEIASSQLLTATAIRNSLTASKIVAQAWLKSVASCKLSTEHKPIDIVILLILYSTSEERQKQVENLIRKQVKLNILQPALLEETFKSFKPMLKCYQQNMLELTNTLLKSHSDSLVQSFASLWYSLMFSELEESRQTVIAELLLLGLNRKQCIASMLGILNNIAANNISLLKPQSLQMLSLLDKMDDMSLTEIKGIMNLVCGLAYSFENSVLRDDVHIIIRKQLGSSEPSTKVKGVLAAVHAVKYLMAHKNDNDDESVESPDDVSYSSFTHLANGATKEAAQLIESISRSTRFFPDLIVFFYDEMSEIVDKATYINKHFLSWLTDAVTNDLQQNFIVDCLPSEKLSGTDLSMQYCLNAEEELDDVIAINIAGLALEALSDDRANIAILPSLFQLVQTLHSKQHNGDLSSIDALLGCPTVMPIFDLDLVEDMDQNEICITLNCFIYCVNWFRELVNGFATQSEESLNLKILQRIQQIDHIENTISRILLNNKEVYKPPTCTFSISKYSGIEKKYVKRIPAKPKPSSKPTIADETVLTETGRTQPTQNQPSKDQNFKNRLDGLTKLPLRHLNLNLLVLLNDELTTETAQAGMNIRILKFLLKSISENVAPVLISRIKKNTFLTTHEPDLYDPKKAQIFAKQIHEVLPKLILHLETVTNFINGAIQENNPNDSGYQVSTELLDYLSSLEYLYILLTVYFKWIGFQNDNSSLLKSSLKALLTSTENVSKVSSFKELYLSVAKFLQKQEEHCLQLSTAVALIDLLQAILELSKISTVSKISRDMAFNFLSKSWRTSDGLLERGLLYNQYVEKLAATYFTNTDLKILKSFTLQIKDEIKNLNSKNDVLKSLKCISKAIFPIAYRNICSAVYEAAKKELANGLTDSEHLELWKDVATILKTLTEIAKILENRSNLSAFLKKSQPILRLFLSQGMPIVEIKLKNETQMVVEVLRLLQQSTRFLQTLCCHSRLKKDTALMAKVPQIRLLLETLIYKVKAALAANNCSEAFWMGNLKNKNIQGEVIATQESDASENVEDCDDQLPDDEDSDEDTDNEEMLNPDSKSISDMI